ncbi:gas vesicle protein GvpG [Streptomyces sp. NBC_01808]|uniref:gas vesicle protein GvpG n=1 Tax=Streptomyces sp. NBC_01808 TaxID=2975947 RepID=UPI002DD9163A|nr:gas vesicle protein GvpG [Streptomyces sp. NBC_01808]WSA42080.1 gas vesicle protein GvpG [Streptomyces sp. NBC_01808]
MGLLSGLMLLPLVPVRGVEWVAGRLLDAAEQELYDPATLRVQLGELNRAYEAGELGEEEFEREEERILDLLEQPGTILAAAPADPGGPGHAGGPHHPHHPDHPLNSGSGS